ncbi:glutamate 5-kinase [Canibacter zhoujuaniae]|uniref:glutamate 5-kinase n=1 Tax=Canibacter zhoujuaniae TaxID=2708343 RepID=UPI0014230BF6|nr:glutamate 5-kinase [Canibacter zhoujuaniae]
MADNRKLQHGNRIVVKVGSSSVSGENKQQIPQLAASLARLHAAGSEVILVSSGAISSGVPFLQLSARPEDLATQQAAAAVGQNVLINRYQRAFGFYDIVIGQILLTPSDFDSAERSANAQATLNRMLELGAIPIINENDSVATTEIRFGDNDRLASLVAKLVKADQLVLLSDVAALYTAPPNNPEAQPIQFVPFGDDLSGVQIGEAKSGWGTGGALTKVAAAKYAAAHGVRVVLTDTKLFAALIDGESHGTWFEPRKI